MKVSPKKNKKNFFHLENDYTGEEQFSLLLRKLDSTSAKFLSDKIAMEFLIRDKKLQEKGKCMISFQLKTPLQLKTTRFWEFKI